MRLWFWLKAGEGKDSIVNKRHEKHSGATGVCWRRERVGNKNSANWKERKLGAPNTRLIRQLTAEGCERDNERKPMALLLKTVFFLYIYFLSKEKLCGMEGFLLKTAAVTRDWFHLKLDVLGSTINPADSPPYLVGKKGMKKLRLGEINRKAEC